MSGASICLSCPPGSLCATSGLSAPSQQCGGGTYSIAGSISCNQCAVNTYSLSGAQRCSACESSTYSSPGSTSCSTSSSSLRLFKSKSSLSAMATPVNVQSWKSALIQRHRSVRTKPDRVLRIRDWSGSDCDSPQTLPSNIVPLMASNGTASKVITP